MEFPNDLATNVFRIEDVKEIAWAFYTETYRDRRELQEDLLDDEETGLGDNLSLAECALREKGNHVHPDEDNRGIWVFSLSKPEEDGVSQFLNSVGFNYSSSGVLRSVDVDWASGQDGTVQKHETASNAPASMVKGSAEAKTHKFRVHNPSESQAMYYGMDIAQDHNPNSRQDFTTTDIYPRFIAAILQSFSYSVADHGDLLRIGPYTFIESRTLGERLVEDLAWLWPTAKTSIISIQVKWLSSGTLIVAYSRVHIIRLYRASHFLPDDRRSGLSCGVRLLLCPSGVTASLQALEEIPKTHSLHRSGMQLKFSISARLARIGYSVPQDSRWLRVLFVHDLPSRGRQRTTHRSRDASITIWPSQLCLCTDPVALDGRLRDHVDDLTEHGPMDALAKAESWLLGKAGRQKASKNQRRKDDSELRKVKENRESDNDDDLSDIELQANPYIASQDISGIYPTPPDVIPTNILDSSPNNNLPTSGIGNEEDAGSTPSAFSRPYEEHGNEDIYGEMDIDMFASNGLTEADFKFFDEPGINDGTLQEEPTQIMVDDDLEGGIITDPASATMSSEDNTVQLIQSNQVDSGEQNLSVRDGERVQEQGMSSNAEPGKETSLKFDPKDIDEITDVEREATDEVADGSEYFDNEYSSRQQTSFDAVHFDRSSNSFDRKYALRGRYAFDVDDLPMPSRPGKQTLRDGDELPQVGMARARGSSIDDDDLESDQTDGEPSIQSCDLPNEYEDTVAKQQPQHHQSRKRKRDGLEDPEESLRLLASASPRETSAEWRPEASLSFPTQALSFSGTETEYKELLVIEPKSDASHKVVFVGKDSTFIRVAQMVADQAVSGPEIYQTSLERNLEMDSGVMMASDQRLESIMEKLFSNCGKISKRCTLKEYASLRDRDLSNVSEPTLLQQQNQRMPKAFYPTKPAAAAQDIVKLQAPYTCVRRTGAPMDISASALRFWEELSLAPAHGNKNVKAFCIFATSVAASDDVTRFLNMTKDAYQSCNLGLHDLGAGLSDYSDGLVHVPTDDNSVEESLPRLISACKLLGTRLGNLRPQDVDFVIYMVDSSTTNRTVPDLCAAFLDMFEAYNTTLHEQHIDHPSDMVLRILPSSQIFSTEFIPMPTPADYRKLAFDVYDRCSPNQTMIQKSQHRSLSAPAVYLAKAIPKAIDLKLTPESSAPRLQSDNCIHVAYAWTSGDHWLTAAWTDNHGILSWNACYCFGEEDGTPWESFTDIAREIWDTTLDLMQGYSSWRVFLCKDSSADRRELDAWQGILVDLNRRQVSATFLILDTDPLLEFPVQEATNRTAESALNSITTPGANLQSNAASPDISSFGTTPGGPPQVSTPPPSTAYTEHDVEARLIDMSDEIWGVLMNSPSEVSSLSKSATSDSCPALASGYLIKRAGPRDEDGLTRVGIKLLYGKTGHRTVLKEVLGMYAGLALLARVKAIGNVETQGLAKGLLPYHIAAARKAHAALSATMRYGDA